MLTMYQAEKDFLKALISFVLPALLPWKMQRHSIKYFN